MHYALCRDALTKTKCFFKKWHFFHSLISLFWTVKWLHQKCKLHLHCFKNFQSILILTVVMPKQSSLVTLKCFFINSGDHEIQFNKIWILCIEKTSQENCKISCICQNVLQFASFLAELLQMFLLSATDFRNCIWSEKTIGEIWWWWH